jgi:hypothetical protein
MKHLFLMDYDVVEMARCELRTSFQLAMIDRIGGVSVVLPMLQSADGISFI